MMPIYLDVRDKSEFDESHVQGAIHIPYKYISELSPQLHDLPKDARLVTYCGLGQRAEIAKTKLEQLGFMNVENGINQSTIEKSLSK
jgi:rhodanese-related sulfurtransferase